MSKKLTTTLFAFLILLTLVSCKQQKPAEVLVLGTIHNSHTRNPNYSYEDIVHILESFKPDAICVEIRPEDFRKTPYLKEMALASLYGLSKDIPVYPIDWWTKGTREERASYEKTEEYKDKKILVDSMRKASVIIQDFENKNGTWKDFSRKKGYLWYNGKEYNDYVTENYRISMEVYGDHCMNLHYRSRNDSMMARINEAIRNHPGEKVVILTGAEHKHYFDRALQQQDDALVNQLNNFEIIEQPIAEKAVTTYLEMGDPGMYFPDISKTERFNYIRGNLVPVLHGWNMDFKPYIIPLENIERGSNQLNKLEADYGHLPDFKFEKGWVRFLQGDYQEAIDIMEQVVEDSSNVFSKMKWFVIPSAIRTQGYCYDLMGQRQRAVEKYKEGKKTASAYGELPDWKGRALYDKWIEKPYTHQKPEERR